MTGSLAVLEHEPTELLGGSVHEFLRALGGPTAFVQRGRHRGPRRVLATLLHGDEPSGMRALWTWLRSGAVPFADTLFIVGNVEAAIAGPGFTYRHLDGEPDLNRCFAPPFTGRWGAVCRSMLDVIADFDPACLIDVHNTTGVGPAFGVTPQHSTEHEALMTGFSEKLIVSGIRLGALMEAANEICPSVTVECGGAIDTYADGVAEQGIELFLNAPDPLAAPDRDLPMELLQHPVRVELQPSHTIGFGDGPGGADVVLVRDVERFNFGVVSADRHLGWLGDSGLGALRAMSVDGRDVIADVLSCDGNGVLRPARKLQLFMVTTKPQAARGDCLFYAIRADHVRW
ncbi:MAG: succinylglutamate desuccinylase/aspartoacylase family protein [Actinomycetota bacterium]